MLHIEGTATRTYSETGARVIDLLVMAEELPDPPAKKTKRKGQTLL